MGFAGWVATGIFIGIVIGILLRIFKK